jgi:hypothetical protein
VIRNKRSPQPGHVIWRGRRTHHRGGQQAPARRRGSAIESPNTMSSEPMSAETSASICPRLKKSIAWRWANERARILHL